MGVFRDHDGRVLFEFGKEVCIDSDGHAELMALRERLLVEAASLHSFLFESDCKSIIVLVADH